MIADIDIARKANMEPIADIAGKIGMSEHYEPDPPAI
jgi:formyltetrahydrofolate synthetase